MKYKLNTNGELKLPYKLRQDEFVAFHMDTPKVEIYILQDYIPANNIEPVSVWKVIARDRLMPIPDAKVIDEFKRQRACYNIRLMKLNIAGELIEMNLELAENPKAGNFWVSILNPKKPFDYIRLDSNYLIKKRSE